ncbi:hypothetical protein N0V93_009915 [Gnomoniopsis smithogilvyi]|uniref:Phosphatidylethanolamine-binding protein n=1 Tax=Gnomoniopsis smithogilvyi TaxID=1191159 RepID=A0A9W8YI03_9PEZI|nr:hypothetical protein N0V93_009915 [Gnomoniopsis smithogilvyi]
MPSNKSLDAAFELIKKDPSKLLGLTFGKHSVAEPGQFVSKAETQASPQLTHSSTSPTKTYLAISLDPDAPFAVFPVLGPVLHWIQPGLKSSTSGGSLEATEPFIANWVAASPPPGSAPHRYIFILYEQPEGLETKKFAPKEGQEMGMGPRVRTSLDGWVTKLGLGEPVAVNYCTSN